MFSFKLPTNVKPMNTIKKKLFDGIYPKINHLSKEIEKNDIIPPPSIKEDMKIH